MKIVGCVPIKLNNERLPGKNTKCLKNGKPLISIILSTLREVRALDDIYVFCSDEKITDFTGNEVKFLKREKKLDENSANATDIISSFISLIDADIYVYTHATAPLISKYTIEKCLQKVVSEDFDSAFTAVKLQDFIWKGREPLNFDPSNIPRTQELEPLLVETSGLYIFKKEVFTQHKRRVGFNPYICEVSKREAVDINYPEDFDIANALIDELK